MQEVFDWQPLWLSAQLASLSTLLLLPLGTACVYLLARLPKWAQPPVKALVSLPIVLPPTVMGYYMLLAFRPEGWLAQFTERYLGLQFLFSFEGLVLASVLGGLPFMVNPVLSACEQLPPSLAEAAQMLGKNSLQVFIDIVLPNVKPALFVGAAMCFAHTVGEFGVVLMIGGSIPGVTKTASVAIYHELEMLHYANADRYALVLLGFSLAMLTSIHLLHRKK